MPLYEFFKNLFGAPRHPRDNFDSDREPRAPYFGHNHENDERDENYGQFPDGGAGFHVFTDPLEMHRYFEHQMNEMMRSFNGLFGSDSNIFGFGEVPAIGPPPERQAPNQKLRDQFLKPGYEQPRDKTVIAPKSDTDLDGRIDLSDLDSIMKEKPNQLRPHDDNRRTYFKSFGQSMSTRTVRRPDGTIEMHRTVRDNDGNEETTVTKQVGDKQYSVTTKTDKHGRQEKIENFTNINEEELSKFNDSWVGDRNQTHEHVDLNKWFPFDKFFK